MPDTTIHSLRILFICTSNKDRSPALVSYFRTVYPAGFYDSAGVNKYFTSKHGTQYVEIKQLDWADLIVFAESVHYAVIVKDFGSSWRARFLCLNLGDFKQGENDEDYLQKAEIQILDYIRTNKLERNSSKQT